MAGIGKPEVRHRRSGLQLSDFMLRLNRKCLCIKSIIGFSRPGPGVLLAHLEGCIEEKGRQEVMIMTG